MANWVGKSRATVEPEGNSPWNVGGHGSLLDGFGRHERSGVGVHHRVLPRELVDPAALIQNAPLSENQRYQFYEKGSVSRPAVHGLVAYHNQPPPPAPKPYAISDADSSLHRTTSPFSKYSLGPSGGTPLQSSGAPVGSPARLGVHHQQQQQFLPPVDLQRGQALHAQQARQPATRNLSVDRPGPLATQEKEYLQSELHRLRVEMARLQGTLAASLTAREDPLGSQGGRGSPTYAADFDTSGGYNFGHSSPPLLARGEQSGTLDSTGDDGEFSGSLRVGPKPQHVAEEDYLLTQELAKVPLYPVCHSCYSENYPKILHYVYSSARPPAGSFAPAGEGHPQAAHSGLSPSPLPPLQAKKSNAFAPGRERSTSALSEEENVEATKRAMDRLLQQQGNRKKRVPVASKQHRYSKAEKGVHREKERERWRR